MGRPIDFMNQLTEHIVWNVRLRCFLDGGECISEEQAVSCERCFLGKWLSEEGRSQYSHIPEIRELEGIHCQMHKQVKQIIVAKNSGKASEAEAGLVILQKISDKVIELLTYLDRNFDKSK
ncbi:MAG: CZB domain-containing protein [Candidatus Omnitrophica bacterium]|nr:CZB domain-containing protein [Candidatus Omnitrophota bacterium]